MAILAIFTGRGFTQAMYEELRGKVNWEGDHPNGGVFHAAGFDEAGDIRVVDVWDSQAALDDFFASRLVPAFQALGVPMPEAQIFPMHRATAYPTGIRPYVR
jgi:hypothetical protein